METTDISMAPFTDYLNESKTKIDHWLELALPGHNDTPHRVHKAMRYAMFPGGKRLRPALSLITNEAFGGEEIIVRPTACALEMVHTYSLIHDDLPCMDDDDLRRGQPSCHKAFDEATAVLAGDGLLTRAFGVLARTPQSDLVGRLTTTLAMASGSYGMVGGQMLDLQEMGKTPNIETVKNIHLRKTAALISAAIEMGAICAGVDPNKQAEVASYGQDVGLAFQIMDDILDETSDATTLGKTPGKDAEAGKQTYPAVMGLEPARELALDLARQAQEKAQQLGAQRTDRLSAVAQFVVERIS